MIFMLGYLLLFVSPDCCSPLFNSENSFRTPGSYELQFQKCFHRSAFAWVLCGNLKEYF